uniref:RRM domain-containing protein n=1 Tax=Hucho hucho TaxID=62062 RepID=A0A4W5L738_9TELE
MHLAWHLARGATELCHGCHGQAPWPAAVVHAGFCVPLSDRRNDKYSGQPRGFGFVTFEDPSVIERVLSDTHTLDGRNVEVKRAVPRDSQ